MLPFHREPSWFVPSPCFMGTPAGECLGTHFTGHPTGGCLCSRFTGGPGGLYLVPNPWVAHNWWVPRPIFTESPAVVCLHMETLHKEASWFVPRPCFTESSWWVPMLCFTGSPAVGCLDPASQGIQTLLAFCSHIYILMRHFLYLVHVNVGRHVLCTLGTSLQGRTVIDGVVYWVVFVTSYHPKPN